MLPIAQAVREAAGRLATAGIENPRREARLLLAHALGMEPAQLLAEPETPVQTEAFAVLLARRIAREPIALITGHREFWSLDFSVTSDTLVPRADSETLIEAALVAFPNRDPALRVLDLGTGTGCLLLAVLCEFPAAFGVGIDRLPAAAALARRNAVSLGLAAQAAFLSGDWAAALDGCFDLVLCNPPYIPSAEIATLMPEVALHEPISALSGGPDGLDAYRAIIPRLPTLLAPGAVAILELGRFQAAQVASMAEAQGFMTVPRTDFAGIERVLELRLRR